MGDEGSSEWFMIDGIALPICKCLIFVFVFFFKQKTAYEMIWWLEFRRVLFRSGTPFAESSKLWGSAARQQSNAGQPNLVCWFERSRVLIRHRFQKISNQKIFYHPAVCDVFLAQKWPPLINSSWENGCRQRKMVFRYEKSMKFGNKIGRAHVWTPVTRSSRMPSSAWKKKKK